MIEERSPLVLLGRVQTRLGERLAALNKFAPDRPVSSEFVSCQEAHNIVWCCIQIVAAENRLNRLLWKEIERQSKIASPLTPPLEVTDETNH